MRCRICRDLAPPLDEIAPGRWSACHLNDGCGIDRRCSTSRPKRRNRVPLVLDSPHSGTAYPADFDHAAPRALVRRAEDTYVDEALRLGAAIRRDADRSAVPARYIDPNRHVADIDTELLADAWPGPVTPSRKTEQGIGLVWRLAHGGVPMYARQLARGRSAAAHRALCYDPYHAVVAAALDERHRAFGAVWHLNCHSMPAEGDVNADDPGRARADFVLGDRDGARPARPNSPHSSPQPLAAMGYEVAINDPYKGVELVRKFGRPHERRHSLQIEINRRLYMNETHAGAARRIRVAAARISIVCSTRCATSSWRASR